MKKLLLALLIVLTLSGIAGATVSSETMKVQHACNGTSVTYAYTFKIFSTSEIKAITTTAAGVEATLVLTTDYSVTGAGVTAGGNVVLTAGSKCPDGSTLTLIRNLPYTQQTDYVEGEAFPADSHENALDKLTMQVQQVKEAVGRSIKVPTSSTLTGTATEITPSASKAACFNADATGMTTCDAVAGGGGTDDQTAAEVPFTPTGGVAADDVQDAIAELDTETVKTDDVIPLDKGGTGTATGLLDSNADVLWGFDDTDGAAVEITIGSGLAYTHATHTLALSGTTTGDVVGPTGVAAATAVALYDGTTGKLLKDSLLTVDANGTTNIPAGETYNINGSAHGHAASEVTFTPTGTIAASLVSTAIAEVATDAAVASSLTSGKLNIARMPACSAQYQMLVCDASLEPQYTDVFPLATINADTVTLVDGTDDTKEVNFVLSGITTATNRLLTVQDKNYTLGEHGVTIAAAAPTIDSAGDIAIDTTANQVKYYGSAAKVLDPRHTENASIAAPASGNKVKFRKPYGMTITSIGCVVDAATSAVLDVQECDANGANCTTILSGTKTCTTTYGTATVSDSSISAGGYVFLSVGTVTGSVGYLYVDVNYTVTGE